MTKFIAFLLLAFTCFSCAPSLTEFWIHEDGSGRVESTIDMGEMMGMMKGLIEKEKDEEASEANTPEEDKPEVMDSTMNFYASMSTKKYIWT